MNEHIIAIHFDKTSVGKRIKSSKKRFTWKLEIDKKNHEISLFISKFSGKKTLKIDDQVRFTAKKISTVPVSITDSITVSIQQSGKNFNIFINSIPFHKLFSTNTFSKHPDIIIDPSISWEQKAKLYKAKRRIIMSKREVLSIKPFKAEFPKTSSNLTVPFIKPRSSSMKSL